MPVGVDLVRAVRPILERDVEQCREAYEQARRKLQAVKDKIADLQQHCPHPNVARESGIAQQDCPDCGCPMPLIPVQVST
ncbi:MAG: hypothetical protein Q7T01_01185 [bacterium]|nr:hypothetical protein [bacterium]